MIPKINSAHGSDTRNIINRVIEVLNQHGKTIQDLVAEGQLTPTQYAELITVINGLVKSGEISLSDLSEELKKEIEDATLNLSKKADKTFVNTKLTDVNTQLAQTATKTELNTEKGRIDNLVANAGDTDGNAELLDIRVGWDGVLYPTAGDAVRSIQQFMTTENEEWVI